MQVRAKSSAGFTAAVILAVAVGAATGVQPARAAVGDALSATRFAIVVSGVEIASFNELTGMTTEIEVSEYLQTSDSGVTYKKLPGKAKPPTVTLKGAYDDNAALWSWHEAARTQNLAAARRSCSLVLFGADGKVAARYLLANAYPSRIEVVGVKAGASRVLQQTVTLVADHIERVAN